MRTQWKPLLGARTTGVALEKQNANETSESNRSQSRPPAPARAVEPLPRLTLRLDEVAKSLGVSRRLLEKQRSAGQFPKPDLQMGKAPLWQPETIRKWIEAGGR
jgi:predicted DNA-binding transcriptional regulator AlpA